MASGPRISGSSAFFYGTLMASPVLSRVIYGTTAPEPWQIAALRIRPAVLHSYCRYQVRFVDYPGIVPEAGKTVRGTYVEGLTEGDLWRLDIFEGNEYERKKVRIKILEENGKGEGEEIDTEAYVYVAGRENLSKEEWNFQEFVKSKLSRWVSDSKEYSELDEADPLGGRWWQDGFCAIEPLERSSKPGEAKKEVNEEEIKNAI